MLASTLGDSPSRLAPNSSLTSEFKESPFDPFCKINRMKWHFICDNHIIPGKCNGNPNTVLTIS